MGTSLHRIRGSRVTPVVLVITWLPYIATCCIENPITHVGCGILPPAHAHAHAAQEHSHEGAAPERHAHHREHNGKHGSPHPCCDLAGKCDVNVSSGRPSLAPVQLVSALPVAVDARIRHVELPPDRKGPALAHAPPTYLRNATLLI